MSLQAQAVAAYGHTQTHIRTNRGTEYEAIARVTRDLSRTQKDNKQHYSEFVSAVHANWRLWTHLAASVADKENGLAPDLRARLFYLAEFTEQHSRKILREGADVNILVEINMGVMRGLVASGANQ